MDLACSVALLLLVGLAGIVYGLRRALRGRATHARVEKEGKSALVGKGAMEGFYWIMQPVAVGCDRLGITANAITWLSLLLGLGAAGAFAAGHFGIGAAVATLGSVCDALDGLIARHSGTASDAGEVLDAAIDRWVDFALVAGLGIFFREHLLVLLCALGALMASFMVSYSTAKAEALRVEPPRGSMRRTERTVIVLLAAVLAPIVERLHAGWGELVIAGALGVVAIAGNVSAVGRFAAIRAALARRDGPALRRADVAAEPERSGVR